MGDGQGVGGFVMHFGMGVDWGSADDAVTNTEELELPGHSSFVSVSISVAELVNFLDNETRDIPDHAHSITDEAATVPRGHPGAAFAVAAFCAGKLIVDSGASKTLSPLQLMDEYQHLWYAIFGGTEAFEEVPDYQTICMTLANGSSRNSCGAVSVPVKLSPGNWIQVDHVLMDGPGPMLLSVNVLADMHSTLDFHKRELRVPLPNGETICHLSVMPNGHLFIDLYEPLRNSDSEIFNRALREYRS